MRKYLCSVRDSAAVTFAAPFVAVSQGFAIRMFRDAIARNDVENMMAKHPQDFELYVIGEFEEENGKLIPCEPVMIIRGQDCVALTN